MDSDALAPGLSFEVVGAKKFRRRFHIESIESATAPGTDANCLYSVTKDTVIDFSGSSNTRPSTANGTGHTVTNGIVQAVELPGSTGERTPSIASTRRDIDIHRIGGLLEQTQQLNRQIRRLLDTAIDINCLGTGFLNPAVLLHGYQGCGKTTMINALADCGFRKVYHLEHEALLSGTLSKGRTSIQETFQQAAANQPSLILIDNLEQLAPTDDFKFASTLVKETMKVCGSRVMIVAATRSTTLVRDTILGSDCFSEHIELPVPDVTAREQILKVLCPRLHFTKGNIAQQISQRTHGFTGDDLKGLCKRAAKCAFDRVEQETAEKMGGRI